MLRRLLKSIDQRLRTQPTASSPSVAPTEIDAQELEERVLYSAVPLAEAPTAAEPPLEAADAPEPVDATGDSQSEPKSAAENLIVSVDASILDQEIRREIIFVDAAVEDVQSLLDDLFADVAAERDIEVVMLAADRDGISQISEALAAAPELDAVHIISHGSDGSVQLGDTVLNSASLAGRVGEIASWGFELAPDADLLLYGCNLAASDDGRALIDELSALCACDVAASDDLTGHTDRGGDWILEYQVGDVATDIAFQFLAQSTWMGTLDTSTGLVAHYEFEDGSGSTATDSVGSNNATLGGGASFTTGEIGGALDLVDPDPDPGDPSQGTILSDPALDFGSSDFTIAFWFNSQDSGGGMVLEDYDGTDGYNFLWGFGTLTWTVDSSAANAQMTVTGLAENTWYHVTATRSGNDFKLDLGHVVETDTKSVGSITNSENTAIGLDRNAGFDFQGQVDDLRFYNRALSDADAVELRAMGTGDTTTGLQLHHTFDVDASDSSGNGYDGSLAGGATIDTSSGSNPVGSGKLSLDGSDDYVELSSHSSSFQNQSAGTIAAWVYADSAADGAIFSAADSGDTVSYFSLIRDDDGSIDVHVQEEESSTFYSFATDAGVIAENTWAHVAFTVDAGGNKLYVNGVLQQVTYSSGSSTSTEFLDDISNIDHLSWGIVHRDAVLWTDDFDGFIDDGRIYDRALDAVDIAELAAVSAPIDTDGDGYADSVDQDDDNDGILDTVEDRTAYHLDILAGKSGSYTIYGANYTDTTSKLNNASNFGSGSSITPATVSTVAQSGTVDDSYLGQGRLLWGGFNPDGSYTAGELSAIEKWLTTGGIFVTGNDTSGYDPIAQHFGLPASETVTATWTFENVDHALINGSSGLGVDLRGQSVTATGSYAGFNDSDLLASDIVLARDTGSSIATIVLRQFGDGYILFTGDEGIFRSVSSGSSFSPTDYEDVLLASIVDWVVDTAIAPLVDADRDGTINSLDLDSDNDGLADNVEAQTTSGYIAPNLVYDSNGVDTAYSGGLTPEDTDTDGTYDFLDTDSDGDGRLDVDESGWSSTSDATYADPNGSLNTPATQLQDTHTFASDVDYRDGTYLDLDIISTRDGGLSLNHDGGNGAYLTPVNSGSLFSGESAVTIEVEFSISSPATNMTTLFSYADSSNNDELFLGIDTDGEIYFRTSENGGSGYGSITNAAQLFDGQKHTVSVTWENSGGVLLFYVDGQQLGLGRNDYQKTSTISGGGNLVLGQHQTSAGASFDSADTFSGTYYGVRVFSDVRTAEEIAASYRTQLAHDEDGLLAHWRFDNLSSNDAVTESVSGNNLTVHNASQTGFSPSAPALTLRADEFGVNGAVVGSIVGADAERDAQIAALLAADSDLSYSSETGKFYKVVDSYGSWDSARTGAVGTLLSGVSGQLVTIRSAAENAIVDQLSQDTGFNFWLGATDLTVDGEFRWYDGAAASDQFWQGSSSGYNVDGAFTGWRSGEPDDTSGRSYVEFNQFDSSWDVETSATSSRYIVEWDADAVLDATHEVTYTIASQTESGAFAIDADTGQITVADVSKLDTNVAAAHTIMVRATDANSNTYDQTFTISLADRDDANNLPTDLSSGIGLNTDGGRDDYLVTTNGGAIVGGLDAFTLEFNLATDTFDNWDTLLSYRSPSDEGVNDDAIRFQQANLNQIELVVNGNIAVFALDASQLTDGQPHTLSVSWDNTYGDARLYLDGQLVGSDTGLSAGQTVRTGGTLVIGNEQDQLNAGFTEEAAFRGTLLDARIWDQVRSDSEIALNYQQQFDASNLPSGLVANWQMDGVNGFNEVVDVVGTNHLTLATTAVPAAITGWTNASTGVTVSGSTVTFVDDSAASGWNSQITSPQLSNFGFTDNYTLSFDVPALAAAGSLSGMQAYTIGLSTAESSAAQSDVEYALYFDSNIGGGGVVRVRINAVDSGDYALSYSDGDTFSFHVDGTNIHFQHNGTTFHTESGLSGSEDWYIDTSFYADSSGGYSNQADYSISNIRAFDGNIEKVGAAGSAVTRLTIEENSANGTTVGHVVPTDPDAFHDVVVDGLFREASDPGSYQTYSATASFGNWSVAEGQIVLAGSVWESTPLGGRSVELAASVGGTISQDLTTVAGRTYQIVFVESGDWTGDSTLEYRVSAGGHSQDFVTEEPDNWSYANMLWNQRSMTFTAEDTTTTLSFSSLESGSSAVVLGDVRVIEVPAAVTAILNNDTSLEYDAATGKFYRLVNSPTDFDSALLAATSSSLNGINGQLLTIGSEYENEWVRQRVLDSGTSIWLGITDAALQGTWVEYNGLVADGDKVVSGGAAVSGHYSNISDLDGVGEDYAHIASDGTWHDSGNTGPFTYMVEWAADEVLSNYSYAFASGGDAGGRFTIDGQTGEITVASGSQLNHEVDPSHNVTVEVTDAAGKVYSETLSITVSDIAEPSHSLPAAQVVSEDQVLTFSSGSGNAVSVADNLAASNPPLQVSLAVDYGFLQLSQTTGLTFAAGSNGDASFTFQGTEADINAALEGMTFTPAANFSGSVTLDMSTGLTADLVGHYSFEADAVDQSVGASQDGALTGDAAVTNDAERGQVLQLDGTGDYVNIAGDFSQPTDVTLAAWVNFSSAAVNAGEVISITNAVALRVDDSSQGVTGFFYDGTGFNFIGTGTEISLADDSWHHVAFAFDDVNNVQTLYIDGQAVASGNFTESINYPGWFPQTTIGSHADVVNSSFDFNGKIDDARIYTRALSAAEIQALASDNNTVDGSFNITVNSVNDTPEVSGPGSAYTVNEQTNLTLQGTGFSVTDVDAASGTMTATISVGEGAVTVAVGDSGTTVTGGNGTGAVTVTGTLAQIDALLTASGTGTITYFNGSDTPSSSTTVTVTANDGGNTGTDPGLSGDGSSEEDSASQTINIVALNDVPVIASVESSTLNYFENAGPQPITAALTLSDVDNSDLASAVVRLSVNYAPGQDELLFTDQSGITGAWDGSTGELTLSGSATVAQYETALRSITYHNTSESPSTATRTVSFTVNDGQADSNVATRDIAVTAVNDEQVISTNVSLTLDEGDAGVPITAAFLQTTDVDHDAAQLVYTLDSVPDNGTLRRSGTALGTNDTFTQADIDGGLVTYDHDGSETSSDSFDFTVDDGTGTSSSATFSMVIDPVNDSAPVITSDGGLATAHVNAPENGTDVTTVTATDIDLPAQTITYSIQGGADAGQFLIDGNSGQLTFVAPRNYESPTDADANGVYEVLVQASDGALVDTQTILVTVIGVNEAPTDVTPNSVSVNEHQDTSGGYVVTGLVAADPDAGDTHTFAIVGGPDAAVFSLSGGNQLTLDDGALDYENQSSYQVLVRATDLAGLWIDELITVSVTDLNDRPVAVDDAVTVNEDASVAGNVLGNDSDQDPLDDLSAVLVSGPSHGTLSLLADGSYTYTPQLNYHGTDQFVYRACDGTDLSDLATAAITVDPVNDAPIAVDDQYVINLNTNLTTTGADGLLLNDGDIDGDTLTAVVIAGPSSGSLTLNADGTFLYQPQTGFNGVVTFTYAAHDGTLASTAATVSIVINAGPIVDPPDGDDGDSGDSGDDGTSDTGDDDDASDDGDEIIDSDDPTDEAPAQVGGTSSTSTGGGERSDREATGDGGAETEAATRSGGLPLDGRNTDSNDEALAAFDAVEIGLARHKIDSNVRSAQELYALGEIRLASYESFEYDPQSVQYAMDELELELQQRDEFLQVVSASANYVAIGATAGAAVWMVSGSAIAALLTSALPTAASFDPVFVLRHGMVAKDDEDVSMAEMIKRQQAKKNKQ